MTEFVVKKSSWHYKLNTVMANSRSQFNTWLLYEASFCSYFWLTVFKLIVLIAVIAFVCFLVWFFSYMIYLYPWEVLKAVASLLLISAAVIGFFIGSVLIGRFFEKINKQKVDTEKGFFATKYDSWKHKYCPSIRVEQ